VKDRARTAPTTKAVRLKQTLEAASLGDLTLGHGILDECVLEGLSTLLEPVGPAAGLFSVDMAPSVSMEPGSEPVGTPEESLPVGTEPSVSEELPDGDVMSLQARLGDCLAAAYSSAVQVANELLIPRSNASLLQKHAGSVFLFRQTDSVISEQLSSI